MKVKLKKVISFVFVMFCFNHVYTQSVQEYFWDNDNLKQRSHYKYTMLDGPSYELYSKGNLKSVGENCNDLPCGYRMKWDSTGNLSSIEMIDTMIVITDNYDGFITSTTLPYYDVIKFHKNGKVHCILDNNYPEYSETFYNSEGLIFKKDFYFRLFGTRKDSLIRNVEYDTTFIRSR